MAEEENEKDTCYLWHGNTENGSGRPKRVNTETTETEISVKFTEPKPKLPKRN